MKHILTILLVAAFTGYASGQQTGDSLYFLLPTDTMMVYPDPGTGKLLFDHHLAPKQTIYGAAKFYGTTEEDFYYLKPSLRKGYNVGDVVRVPIPTEVIVRELPEDSLAWFVPIRYKMQKGETLFGLATRRLGWLNDAPLRRLNPELDVNRMQAGETLNIGFMSINGLPATAKGYLDPYMARNRWLKEQWDSRTAGKTMKGANGKGAWTKKGDKDKFMVLHRTAPINSIIELTDPRSRKTIYARVIGRVPPQIYPPRIIVVISPLIVKAFGVRDKEFYVKTRYF